MDQVPTKIEARLPMPAGVTGVSADQWRVLVEAIWPGAKSPEAVALAIDYCRARKLDPFKRPIHVVSMWNATLRREVETVWPGISELQTTAARTGQWAGMDEPKFGPIRRKKFVGMVGRRGEERRAEIDLEFPEWCSITVYRMVAGQRCAFSEPVYWEEAYARMGRNAIPNEMWQKRPRGQLMKVAKAASLRAAFPEETGHEYTAEEMEGGVIDAGGIAIEGHAEPPVSPQPARAAPDRRPPATIEAAVETPPEALEMLDNRPRRRTIGDVVAEVKQAIVEARSVRDVLEIGDRKDVHYVMEKGSDAIKQELRDLMKQAYEHWQSQAGTPEDDGGQPGPDEVSDAAEPDALDDWLDVTPDRPSEPPSIAQQRGAPPPRQPAEHQGLRERPAADEEDQLVGIPNDGQWINAMCTNVRSAATVAAVESLRVFPSMLHRFQRIKREHPDLAKRLEDAIEARKSELAGEDAGIERG